jgi:hypothetical protein
MPVWGRLCPPGATRRPGDLYPLRVGRKRIRAAPSDRGTSRRQRVRPPLSTGRPDPFPSPTPRPAGAVWQPCHRTGRKTGWMRASPAPMRARSRLASVVPASLPGSGPWAATYRASRRCQPPGTSPGRCRPDSSEATPGRPLPGPLPGRSWRDLRLNRYRPPARPQSASKRLNCANDANGPEQHEAPGAPAWPATARGPRPCRSRWPPPAARRGRWPRTGCARGRPGRPRWPRT